MHCTNDASHLGGHAHARVGGGGGGGAFLVVPLPFGTLQMNPMGPSWLIILGAILDHIRGTTQEFLGSEAGEALRPGRPVAPYQAGIST